MYLDSAIFDYSDGFAVAAGIPYGEQGVWGEGVPADIGALKFYRKSWTPGSDTLFYEIPIRKCTREDFNFGDGSDTSKALFYPTEKSLADLKNHWNDMLCPVDVKDFYGNGNFDSTVANNLMVVFENCNQAKETAGKTGVRCKSEDLIVEWMKYKYITTLTN